MELIIASAGKGFRLEDGKTVVQQVKFKLELDGYHAPLTAGIARSRVIRMYRVDVEM